MYELFDDTAAATLLAIDEGESIRRVAQQIGTPYETVRQAVNALEDAGFVRYDDGLSVVDQKVLTATYTLVTAAARVSPPTIEEAYVLPHFADAPFAFTGIDAVYVWTRGGFQVARSPDDYPLFVAIEEADLEYWERFLADFGLPVAEQRQPAAEIDRAVQFVLQPRAHLDVEWVEGYPVIPREETIEYMDERFATFQSALAMLDDMYEDLNLDVTYREEADP